MPEEEIAEWPTGPAGAWAAIRQMRASFVSAEAELHEGLGLDAYVQATAPRRHYCPLPLIMAILPTLGASFLDSDTGRGSRSRQLIHHTRASLSSYPPHPFRVAGHLADSEIR